MKNIKIALWAILLTLTGLWLLADTPIPEPFTYFSFRSVAVQYSGVMAIAIMSAAMILAAWPRLIEQHLNGRDKLYRLHKWLGIAGLTFAVTHWWLAQGTKWMVGWGWLTRPERRPRGAQTVGEVEGWLRGQRGLAESLGEWAFYAAVVLMVLALFKMLPPRWFARTHKWLAAVYLVLVYHAVVLTKFSYWTQPVGWLMAAAMVGGTVAAVEVLLGLAGSRRKARAAIQLPA